MLTLMLLGSVFVLGAVIVAWRLGRESEQERMRRDIDRRLRRWGL